MASPFKKSIQNVYKKMILWSFMTSLVSIVIGIILLFMPEISNKLLGIIIGISFLITGIGTIYNYFNRKGAKIYTLNIAFGIIFSLIGAFIIIYPFSIAKFVTSCLGLFLIVNGAMKVNHAFWLKRGSEDCWLITITSGVLLLTFGIMVLFNPFKATMTITKVAGIFVLINGILDFMNTFLYNKRAKEIMNIFW
ncbi:MAG: hypothetical protein E7172_02110 [Firmicutes bacterium]|nr:hypothetical protein [Bacillota bacterium]